MRPSRTGPLPTLDRSHPHSRMRCPERAVSATTQRTAVPPLLERTNHRRSDSVRILTCKLATTLEQPKAQDNKSERASKRGPTKAATTTATNSNNNNNNSFFLLFHFCIGFHQHTPKSTPCGITTYTLILLQTTTLEQTYFDFFGVSSIVSRTNMSTSKRREREREKESERN